jgi:hypothetical protein
VRTPVASQMAFATTPAVPVTPLSPTPLMPSALTCGSCSSTSSVSRSLRHESGTATFHNLSLRESGTSRRPEASQRSKSDMKRLTPMRHPQRCKHPTNRPGRSAQLNLRLRASCRSRLDTWTRPVSSPRTDRRRGFFFHRPAPTAGNRISTGLGGGPTRAKLGTGFFAFLGPLNATDKSQRPAVTPTSFGS